MPIMYPFRNEEHAIQTLLDLGYGFGYPNSFSFDYGHILRPNQNYVIPEDETTSECKALMFLEYMGAWTKFYSTSVIEADSSTPEDLGYSRVRTPTSDRIREIPVAPPPSGLYDSFTTFPSIATYSPPTWYQSTGTIDNITIRLTPNGTYTIDTTD